MNPLRLIAPTLLLALVGCDTTAPRFEASPPAAALGSGATTNPLGGLKPEFPEEQTLLSASPNAAAFAEWARTLGNRAAREDDAEAARKLNLRARRFAVAAQQLGSRDLMLDVILAATKPDGSPVEITYSNQTEANRLVAEGEKKFGRDDFDGALKLYQEALVIDPHSYHAALYAGDACFARKDHRAAVEWFDRAIAISPLRETAHRYRGDALLHLGRYNDARDAYIDALIADPYNKLTRAMLPRWASVAGSRVRTPDTSFLRGELKPEDDKLAIHINPDTGALCLAYMLARVKHTEEQSLSPASYHHTLAEEAEALRLVLQIARKIREKDPKDRELIDHAEAIELLEQLDRDGLLEAHIFMDRPDADLAADYAAYREKNAAVLARYVREIWLGEK